MPTGAATLTFPFFLWLEDSVGVSCVFVISVSDLRQSVTPAGQGGEDKVK